MTLIQPRNFHRLALAVNDVPEAAAWLQRVLGAIPMGGSADATVSEGLAGTMTKLQWVGGYPVILLGGGMVERFLQRQGPGVQSWAWEVDDNWAVEHLVRDRGIEVISVNIQGRFFFMHPSQTYGLLMEWCDGKMPRDPRATEPGRGVVEVTELAWVTGVVSDAEATAEWLSGLAETTVVEGNARGPEDHEHTIDLKVGDITVRLVTPRSPASRYAEFLERGPRVHSFAIRVPDLDAALGALEGVGITTAHREDRLASTDPATTLGLRIDWTQ